MASDRYIFSPVESRASCAQRYTNRHTFRTLRWERGLYPWVSPLLSPMPLHCTPRPRRDGDTEPELCVYDRSVARSGRVHAAYNTVSTPYQAWWYGRGILPLPLPTMVGRLPVLHVLPLSTMVGRLPVLHVPLSTMGAGRCMCCMPLPLQGSREGYVLHASHTNGRRRVVCAACLSHPREEGEYYAPHTSHTHGRRESTMRLMPLSYPKEEESTMRLMPPSHPKENRDLYAPHASFSP